MKKFYTSNFEAYEKFSPEEKARAVAVCAKAPKWFEGDHFPELAPDFEKIKPFKNGEIDPETFVADYLKKLRDIDFSEYDFEDKILLCYCSPDEYCHRQDLSKLLVHSGEYDAFHEIRK